MPLVTLKSRLSNIQKPNSTPDKPTPNLEVVDYFTNVNSQGFTVNRYGQRNTEFKIGTQNQDNIRDSRGNVDIEFNRFKKYPVMTYQSPSRLLSMHTKDDFLGDLYSQSQNDRSRLGMRTTTRFGFDQPFIIRNIGDRWGPDGLSQPNFASSVITDAVGFGVSLLDDIGESLFGRSLIEYSGNALANVIRTGKFLGTPRGQAFIFKQKELVKRNAQSERTDVRYGIASDLSLESNRDENSLGELSKRLQDTRSYDIKSLASLPGVAHLNINKSGPGAIVDKFKTTIKDAITKEALKAAAEVTPNVIDKLRSIDLGERGQVIGRRLAKFKSNLSEKKNEFVNKYSFSIEDLAGDNEKNRERIKKVSRFITSSAKTAISKAVQVNLDKQAFSEVGRDKVNLIPYGSDKYLGTSYKDLDFCPFKFYDVNNKKSIVFRAILSGITDTFTPEYSSERYVGRPDNVFAYQGTNREIGFTFDIYPKSDMELVTLWEKINYLAGLTYPSWEKSNGGGQAMIAPFCKLTIGDMYKDTTGYISSLTFSVQENGTWETTFAKLPKYIQAQCNFIYVGERLPSTTQKHYELPWVAEQKYKFLNIDSQLRKIEELNRFGIGNRIGLDKLDTSAIKKYVK